MKYAVAIMSLLFNFFKAALLSGLDTARLILRNPQLTHSGLTRMKYDELGESSANVLGLLVTLTPGTTIVEINHVRQEFVLHLLDMNQRDAIVAAIQRDFAVHLSLLSGKK